ncbi:MAG: ECF transporter S component [Ruminococcaceae bacterium]|nr:ECF transporter S component [Oscillospiraceae bacterium]
MNKQTSKNTRHVRELVYMAVFTALAFAIALVIRFPVPPFLTLDLKDAAIAIGAMACGPFSAILMTAAVAMLEFFTVGDTGVYGLIMDVLSSVGFAFTAALIYKYKKTFAGAVLSLISAVFVMTSVMVAANLLITPYYMGVSVSAVRDMIPTLLLPFNFLKATLNAAVVALLYKPLTKALSRILGKQNRHPVTHKKGNRSLWMTFVALGVIIAALLVLFLAMDAGVDFFK